MATLIMLGALVALWVAVIVLVVLAARAWRQMRVEAGRVPRYEHVGRPAAVGGVHRDRSRCRGHQVGEPTVDDGSEW